MSHDSTTPRGAVAPGREGGRFPSPVVLLFQVVATVAALVGAGAIAGLVWFHLWDEPTGVVQQGQWFTDETGLRADFSGTGLYVVIALATGVVVGGLVALAFDRSEVLTLVAMTAGAFLAGWVMWKVGIHGSPPDPDKLALTAPDGTRLPGDLHLSRRTPFVALPLGAVVAYALVLLAVPKRGSRRAQAPDAAAANSPFGEGYRG